MNKKRLIKKEQMIYFEWDDVSLEQIEYDIQKFKTHGVNHIEIDHDEYRGMQFKCFINREESDEEFHERLNVENERKNLLKERDRLEYLRLKKIFEY
jgi:hypothetical protein